MVTSWFTARKAQNVKSIQTYTELQNSPKIRHKNARFAKVFTYHRINNVSIGKKNISK